MLIVSFGGKKEPMLIVMFHLKATMYTMAVWFNGYSSFAIKMV
jgi:hypothetical protein